MPIAISLPRRLPLMHVKDGNVTGVVRTATYVDWLRWRFTWKPKLVGTTFADWPWLPEIHAGMWKSGRLCVVVARGTRIEGMLSLNAVDRRSRLAGARGEPILYVEYISGAPWNQSKNRAEREIVSRPRHRIRRAPLEL